jgi:outer membrane protein OmpA-like peptidoglycan-associated protein
MTTPTTPAAPTSRTRLRGPSRHGRSLRRRPLALLAVAAVLASATACGDGTAVSTAPAGGVALVVGAHANAPHPTLADGVVQELEAAAASGARIAVVVNDGTPSVILDGSLASTAKNQYAQQRDADRAVSQVAEVLATGRADDGESDLLAALDQAVRAVSDAAGPRTLLVVDSGLQTAGALRFQDAGMLAADPQEVVAYLADTGQLPSLAGTRVVLSGVGDTAPPQEPLSPAQRRSLVELWTQIATAAGADAVDVLDAPLSRPPAAGLPAVTPVPVPQPVPPTLSVEPVRLSEESVAFLPDTADFRDPDGAAAVLRPIAQQAVAAGSALHLSGTTSSAGTQEGRRKLSLARAETVKQSLVQLGVPAERIRVSGLGSDWPGYVEDRDAGGALLPAAAAQNRSVLVQVADG